MFASQRRNLEAFAEANQMMVESAQEISRRQAEVARDTVEQYLQASREMLTGGTPEANLGRQAELARSMFEQSLNNLREVSELATKSSFEAFDLLNRRAAESFSDAAPKQAPKRKSA